MVFWNFADSYFSRATVSATLFHKLAMLKLLIGGLEVGELYCQAFLACMVFVFLALIEFSIVNNYMRKSDKFEKLSNKYSASKGKKK